MYALLAVCLSLCPQANLVEENVNTQLRDKYNEKMTKMLRYDDEAYAVYDELFTYACPKFITPSAPVLEEPLTNYNQVILIIIIFPSCIVYTYQIFYHFIASLTLSSLPF